MIGFPLVFDRIIKRKYILINAEPHPRPLSRGEGRKKRTNAPLSTGEGLGRPTLG
jgi:hypothetical protein